MQLVSIKLERMTSDFSFVGNPFGANGFPTNEKSDVIRSRFIETNCNSWTN